MSDDSELHYLSIDTAGRLIKAGKLSPVELTEAYLTRIDALDHRLHSYINVAADTAMTAARVAEQEIRKDGYRGPLHGIPIALKDLVDTAGVPTTFGCKVYKDRVPSADSTAAARLKAAGCILLGKLTMSELAMVGPPGFGEEARNPWNTEYAPSGSSSGSGVSVAAGLCAGSLGSDTGGSIRFPASYNGIVGLMPTYGRGQSSWHHAAQLDPRSSRSHDPHGGRCGVDAERHRRSRPQRQNHLKRAGAGFSRHTEWRRQRAQGRDSGGHLRGQSPRHPKGGGAGDRRFRVFGGAQQGNKSAQL